MMRARRLWIGWALVALALAACDDGGGGGDDGGAPPIDTGVDGQAPDGAPDAMPDAAPRPDAMPDAISDPDAMPDAMPDPDAAPDAASDATVDGAVDAVVDADVDAIVDAVVDAQIDAVVDAEIDAGPPPCITDSECLIFEICAEGRCAPAPGCLVDFDCADARLCADGRCAGAPACGELEPCEGGRPCIDGRCAQQTCADDGVCGDDALCLDGRCAVADCRDAFDCDPGQRCLRNLCISGDCVDDGDCGDSALCFENRCGPGDCRVDEQCPDGALCLTNVCTPADCRDDIDCGPGALCLDTLCIAGDCRGDAECGAGALCEGNRCVPGDCRGDDGCPDGSLCLDRTCTAADCRDDGACPPGALCLANRCTAADCRDDGECAAGESCVRNTCIVGDCLDGADCGPDQSCIRNACVDGDCLLDGDCAAGALCLDQQCAVADCRADGDCPRGELCFDNQCTPADCRVTDDCAADQTCIRNACVDGDCLIDPDCGDGELCLGQQCTVADCRVEADCGAGEACIRNTCVLGDCLDDIDCEAGILCLANTCTPGGCRGDGDCAAGSLCFGDRCEEAECRDDDGCRAGQLCLDRACISGDCRVDGECDAGELCLSNRCTEADCRATEDCPGDENCVRNTCVDGDCLDDGDCGAGSLCLGNACTPGNCRVDGECGAGELCLDNACAVADCRADGECAAGELCLSNACTPADCRVVADCAAGELCEANRCVPDPALASCRAALAFPVDGVVRGDLRGAPAVQAGSCGGDGSERVYTRTAGPATQCLRVVESDGPLVLHARSDCGDADSEVACAAAPPVGTGLTLDGAEGSTWFIFVDAPAGSEGRFTLSVVPGACPATCEADPECPAGQLCTDRLCRPAPACADDAACAEGRICLDGRCAPPQCDDDPDCAGGTLCLEQRCVAADCRLDEDCAEGLCFDNACQLDRCRLDDDCAEGLCFDTFCVADGCREDGDCAEGLCFEERCQLDRCRLDDHCAVGLCFDTFCVADGCRADEDCAEGLCIGERCLADGCREDEDCAEGLCIDNQCLADGCRLDEDCAEGLCIGNQCRVNGCREDEDCLDGICIDQQCAPGCRDDEDCAEGLCLGQACVVGGCRFDDDCGEDELCLDNVCAPGNCREDFECDGGICELNVCGPPQCDGGEIPCDEGQFCVRGRCVEADGDFGVCEAPLFIEVGQPVAGSVIGAPSQVSGFCGGDGPETVYLFVPPFPAPYCIHITEANFDTTLSVLEDCDEFESTLECNDDGDFAGGLLSDVTVFPGFDEGGVRPLFIYVEALDEEDAGTFEMQIDFGECGQAIFCEGPFDCPPGQTCDGEGICGPAECEVAGDCGEGEICEFGRCVEPDCIEDLDCGEGALCVEGACLVPDCFEDADCGVDEGGEPLLCDAFRCRPDVPIGTCATPLPVSAGETEFGTTAFSASIYGASCAGGAQSPEQVYVFVPERTSRYCASTSGSEYDTALYARTECAAQATEFVCNDDFDGVQSQISFDAEAAVPVFLFVDGFSDGNFGDYQLDVTRGGCGEPPPCDFDADCLASELCLEGICVADPCAEPVPIEGPGIYQANNVNALALQTASCGLGLDGPETIFAVTPAVDGPLCLSTAGSSFDTVLSVRAAVCDDLLSEVACNDDDDTVGNRQSRLTLDATAEATYYVLVDGYEGGAGEITLEVSDGPCVLDLVECHALADCPADSLCIDKRCVADASLGGCEAPTPIADFGVVQGNTRQTGQAVFGAVCGGGASSVEDVYVFTPETSGPVCFNLDGTIFDTVLHVRAGDCVSTGAQVACNDDAPGLAAGVASAATVDARAGVDYYVFVDGFGFARGDYTLQVSPGPCRPGCEENADCRIGLGCVAGGCAVPCVEDDDCPAGDRCVANGCEEAADAGTCEAPIVIETPVGIHTANTSGAAAVLEPVCSDAPSGAEAVFAFTAEADGALCVTTEGSGFDTVLTVQREPCGGPGFLGCNDDSDQQQGSPFNSAVNVAARAGQTYYAIVDGVGGGGGRVVLDIREGKCRRPSFSGIRQDVPEAEILELGFEQCFVNRYNQSTPMAGVLQQCNQNVLLWACRPAGAANLTLAAMGERGVILTDLGNQNGATINHNGVDWYYSDSYSMGFVGEGTGVSRNSCDTRNVEPELRMCWHSSGGNMTSGYRCGNTFLNGNNGWERLIYQRSGSL